MKNLKKLRHQNSITLIALIITIIVLIILALVSIATISKQNGTVNKASQAKIENAHAEVFERLSLEAQVHYALVLYAGYTRTILDYLKEEQKYVKEDNTVDMNTLLNGHLLVTGNGSNGKDVYKVEEQVTEVEKLAETEKKKFIVNYYDENGEVTKIGELINNTLHTEEKE